MCTVMCTYIIYVYILNHDILASGLMNFWGKPILKGFVTTPSKFLHIDLPQAPMKAQDANWLSYVKLLNRCYCSFHSCSNYTGKRPQTVWGVGSQCTRYKQQQLCNTSRWVRHYRKNPSVWTHCLGERNRSDSLGEVPWRCPTRLFWVTAIFPRCSCIRM